MKLSTFIAAGAFIFLSAFVMKKEKGKQTPLFDTKWKLTRMETRGSMLEVNTKAFIMFNKEKKSAGGNGGCNTFGSTSTVDGNKISFSGIFSTKMFCEGVQQSEDVFFRQLEKVSRFEVRDHSLFLFNGKSLLLEFRSE